MDCGYSLEPPRLSEANLTCIHNQCFEKKNKKSITIFHLKILIFSGVKYRSILHGHVCLMVPAKLPPESNNICCQWH